MPEMSDLCYLGKTRFNPFKSTRNHLRWSVLFVLSATPPPTPNVKAKSMNYENLESNLVAKVVAKMMHGKDAASG